MIEAAQCSASGDFRVMTYEEIAAGKLDVRADAVVCNFSLLGKESVEGIFRTAASLLRPQGCFIVQTLHPVMACAVIYPTRTVGTKAHGMASMAVLSTRLPGISEQSKAG